MKRFPSVLIVLLALPACSDLLGQSCPSVANSRSPTDDGGYSVKFGTSVCGGNYQAREIEPRNEGQIGVFEKAKDGTFSPEPSITIRVGESSNPVKLLAILAPAPGSEGVSRVLIGYHNQAPPGNYVAIFSAKSGNLLKRVSIPFSFHILVKVDEETITLQDINRPPQTFSLK